MPSIFFSMILIITPTTPMPKINIIKNIQKRKLETSLVYLLRTEYLCHKYFAYNIHTLVYRSENNNDI